MRVAETLKSIRVRHVSVVQSMLDSSHHPSFLVCFVLLFFRRWVTGDTLERTTLTRRVL